MAGYERRAWRIQKQINQLREERAECEHAAEGFRASLGEPLPRLRDRNRFFNSLLNGERDVFDRKYPLWRDFRRASRKASRVARRLAAKEHKIRLVVRGGVADSGLQAKLAREKAARRSCDELLKSISKVRRRINRANKRRPQTDASRVAVDQEVKEVADLNSAVRRLIGDVTRKTSPHRSFDAGDVVRLEIEFPGGNGDHKVRAKKYDEARTLLGSVETRVKSVLGDIGRREKDLEDQLRQRATKERARFNETTPPPS